MNFNLIAFAVLSFTIAGVWAYYFYKKKKAQAAILQNQSITENNDNDYEDED